MSTLRQKMAVRQASKDSHSIEIGEHRKQLALSPGAATDRTASTAHEMPGGGFMRSASREMFYKVSAVVIEYSRLSWS